MLEKHAMLKSEYVWRSVTVDSSNTLLFNDLFNTVC